MVSEVVVLGAVLPQRFANRCGRRATISSKAGLLGLARRMKYIDRLHCMVYSGEVCGMSKKGQNPCCTP